jgi:hypothetical protein
MDATVASGYDALEVARISFEFLVHKTATTADMTDYLVGP